jgi:hypothetical protein
VVPGWVAKPRSSLGEAAIVLAEGFQIICEDLVQLIISLDGYCGQSSVYCGTIDTSSVVASCAGGLLIKCLVRHCFASLGPEGYTCGLVVVIMLVVHERGVLLCFGIGLDR